MHSTVVLQRQMTSGQITSQMLVEQSLKAIADGAAFNAFITIDAEGARLRARELDELREQGEILGPLHGIPVAVKDNIHVAGIPNTAGTAALKDFIPSRDAGVVQRLKAAGAIIIGKNNMHELAFGITSNNYTFGAVGNAYDAKYIPGGSSGGTAVAIASGMVPVGLGTDTGGSSRIPAALNGLAGFRPSTGRYPADGLTRISQTRDTVGPMAHTVADIALLDSVLSGEPISNTDIDLATLRLGVPRGYFYQNLEPAVAQRAQEVLVALQQAGVTLIEADMPDIAQHNERVGFPLVLFEAKPLLEAYVAANLPGKTLDDLIAEISSPDVIEVMTSIANGVIPETLYQEALEKHRPLMQQAYREYFREYRVDAIIFPTMPLTARPIEGSLEAVELNGEMVPTFPTYIHNTDPASNAGIPGLTIPAGVAENGMPIGIEIDGPEDSDQRLLAIGAAIEELLAR